MNKLNTLPCLRPGPKKQQGAVLIVSLLILLVLTMFGITGARTSTMEEKMVGNMRQQLISFQAAEAAIRDGENWLKPLIKEPGAVDACASPPCAVWEADVLQVHNYQANAFSWWQTNGVEYGTPNVQEFTEAADDPVYIVEKFAASPKSLVMGKGKMKSQRTVYRVNAAGISGSKTTRSMIETMYANIYFGH